ETNRGVLGVRLGEAFLYSLSPFRLLELVVPFPFGEVWTIDTSRIWGFPIFQGRAIGFFATFYTGALAAIALATMGRRQLAGARRLPQQSGWLAIAVVGGEDKNAPIAAQVLPEALAEAGLFWTATVVALDLLKRGGRRALWASVLLLTAVPIVANRRIARTFR